MTMKEDELVNLERLAESFASLGNITRQITVSYGNLESRFEDQNARLERINDLLRRSLLERNQIANYLSNILESLTSGVIVTDENGVINVFNSAAEVLSEIKTENAIGRDFFELFRGLEFLKAREVLEGLKKNISGEAYCENNPGKSIPVAYSVSRLKGDEREGGLGIVVILHNLTEIKRLEENLKQVSTLAALGEMAATVAHEIRNPLAGIVGFTSLLMKDLAGDEAKLRLADKINRGVASLNAIVGNLLDYTRTITPEMVDTDPVPLIEDTVTVIRAESNRDNMEIDIITDSKKLVAKLDPFLFQQMTLNLIKNAIQANSENPRVTVMLKMTSDGFTVEISDNGPGIPADYEEKIFMPFFTTKTNGTGLGLAIVKKLTELQGGSITAGNKPDGGAVFRFCIPQGSGGTK